MTSNDRLNETLADIQNMLTRFTWEVMDEEQRDETMTKIVVPRWGKTTRDGKELKGTLWGEILGTTEETVRSRYRRISDRLTEENSRSDGVSTRLRTGLTDSQKGQVRHVKAASRSPELAKAMVSDPEVRAALKEAMQMEGPDLEAIAAAANKARREEREQALQERRALEAEQANIRAQEQAKAAEATRKQREQDAERIRTLEAAARTAAAAQEFDLSTLTQAQKAEIMTILANDPDTADAWFESQRKERKRRLALEESKAREAAEKRREQMEDRERRNAQTKASQEYEDSALRAFADLEAAALIVKDLLEAKGGVTFSHITTSGRLANDWVLASEMVEDVTVAVRESIFEANAESQLQEVSDN